MAEMEKSSKGNTANNTSSTAFTPMSESDMEKPNKSRKRELIAAAIGEGISYLSNLFFATKGAPAAKTTTGKQRQPTLIERIYGMHKEEDKIYNSNLSAWEKEQGKKRKEAERHARENDVIEDIHPDFRPTVKNWEKKRWA